VSPAQVARVARRSVLVVPAGDERKIGKAWSSGADEVVFDLEDAVAADQKVRARHMLMAFLVEHRGSAPAAATRVAVRINPAGSPWFEADLAALASAPASVGSVVLPKAETPADVHAVASVLGVAENGATTSPPVTIQPLIESALGVHNAAGIATASPRVDALVLGYADLAASLGRYLDSPADVWAPTQDCVLRAARLAGVDMIDGPQLSIEDGPELRAWTERIGQFGFDGKWVIHPGQVATVTAIFTPDDEAVAEAQAILNALQCGIDEGRGAVAHNGVMIDEAVAVSARRIVARATDYPQSPASRTD
jgi:citrate lyase beta subunit